MTNQKPEPNKKRWYRTWWGIMILIFGPLIALSSFLIVSFVFLGAIATIADLNSDTTGPTRETPPPALQKEDVKEDDQKTTEQEVASKYQAVLDTYSPIYCQNHQETKVNEPNLLNEGWPMADNRAGITQEECSLLIGMLYYQRVNDTRVEQYIKSVSEKKVATGMTKIEVVYAWGSPNDIKRSIYSNATYEQWIFGNPLYGASYVYFDNDKVTSIQN